MEKTFDFNTIGKRMPYSVPDGFFDKMEENVVASLSEELRMKNEELSEQREPTCSHDLSSRDDNGRSQFASVPRENTKKARTVKIAVRYAFAVAATFALFFVVRTTLPKAASEREQIDARIAFAERERARPKVKSEPVLASADDYASVELAFNNLSTDDQDFLIQVYEEDEFINVLTDTEDYEEDL